MTSETASVATDALADLLREKRVSRAEWDGMLRAGRIFAAKAFYRQPADYGVQLEDLEQASRIGVWLALQRFDPARGLKFSTFAWEYSRGYVSKEYRQWNHLPHSQEEKIAAGKRERAPHEYRPLSLEALTDDLDSSALAIRDPAGDEDGLSVAAAALRSAVDTLPEPLRRTMRLYLETEDVSLIARQEQRTRQAIYGRLGYAKRLLLIALQGRV